MKPMNAAEIIRQRLGCDILTVEPEKKPKKKKIRYGDLLKAAFDSKRHEAKLAAAKARTSRPPLALAA